MSAREPCEARPVLFDTDVRSSVASASPRIDRLLAHEMRGAALYLSDWANDY